MPPRLSLPREVRSLRRARLDGVRPLRFNATWLEAAQSFAIGLRAGGVAGLGRSRFPLRPCAWRRSRLLQATVQSILAPPDAIASVEVDVRRLQTRIRAALHSGDFVTAARLLGRPYASTARSCRQRLGAPSDSYRKLDSPAGTAVVGITPASCMRRLHPGLVFEFRHPAHVDGTERCWNTIFDSTATYTAAASRSIRANCATRKIPRSGPGREDAP